LAPNLESCVSPLFLADSAVGLRTTLGEQSASDRLAVFETPRLDPHEALAMLQTLCERLGVGLSIRMAERTVAQFGGIPLYIHSVVRRAHVAGLALDKTDHLGGAYAQEIRDGSIHWFWRAQFSTQFPRSADRHLAIEMCAYLAGCYPEREPLARLSKRLAVEPEKLQETIGQLQHLGVLDRSFGTVGLVDDPVLRDVVTVLAWGDNFAVTDAELLRRLAARRVCGASTPPIEETIGEFLVRLEHFLQSFRGQYVPAEWFHYHEDCGIGWANSKNSRQSLGSSDTMVRLPFLTAISRMEIARPVGERTEPRPFLLCGSGFRDQQLTPGNETQWLAVVWPAAAPVGVEHVNETERLKHEMATRTGREASHVWLIAKAAFSREARRRCSQLGYFTGNMAMVDYIHDQMFAEGSPYGNPAAHPGSAPDMIVGRPAAAPVEPPTREEVRDKRQEAGGGR
jgi:hypothetical protein